MVPLTSPGVQCSECKVRDYRQFLGKQLPSSQPQNPIRRQHLPRGKPLRRSSCRATLPTASEVTWAPGTRLAGEPEPHAYGRPAGLLAAWPGAFSPLCSPFGSSAGALWHRLAQKKDSSFPAERQECAGTAVYLQRCGSREPPLSWSVGSQSSQLPWVQSPTTSYLLL